MFSTAAAQRGALRVELVLELANHSKSFSDEAGWIAPGLAGVEGINGPDPGKVMSDTLKTKGSSMHLMHFIWF